MGLCKVLVSSCLLGAPVRYDGGAFACAQTLARWQQEGRVVALCPEVAGGLPTPRAPAEIIHSTQQVKTCEGLDVTQAFDDGAECAVKLVREYGIQMAVLKARSPSCGNQEVYDGSFSGQLRAGQGVTAKRLTELGVKVFNEQQLPEALAFLNTLEGR